MLLAAPLVLILALGAALTWRGLRGRRIDDHPLCRSCGYDLVASGLGVEGGATICPECGRDVSVAGSVRIGHRRKRKLALTLGLILLLLTLGGSGGLGYSSARGFNWNPYKPFWLLHHDAGSSDAKTAVAAQQEIFIRLAAGKLSQSNIDSIVSEALRVQPDPNAAWNIWWGDFIETAWQMGKVNDATIVQYAKTAIAMSYQLDLPAKSRQNSQAMLMVSHAPMRAGGGGSIAYEFQGGAVTLEGGTVFARSAGRSSSVITAGSSGNGGSSVHMNLPVGKHTATMNSVVRIWSASAMPSQSFSISSLGGISTQHDTDEPKPLAEWTLALPAQIEIVGPDAEIVERVHDDALEADMRRAITVKSVQSLATSQGAAVLVDVSIRNPPMNIAFDVFMRVGDREWLVATCAAEENTGRKALARPRAQRPIADFPATVEQVDLVFRPNVRLAEEAGFTRMWDGEVVLKDVPVTRVQPRGR